jgi:hypothetical protein
LPFSVSLAADFRFLCVQSCSVNLYDVLISESHLLANPDGAARSTKRRGGAISVVMGKLIVLASRLEHCTATPWQGEWDVCINSFSNATSLCAAGLGGAIATDSTSVQSQSRAPHALQHKSRMHSQLFHLTRGASSPDLSFSVLVSLAAARML